MREYLFRGKCKDSGEWLFGDLRQWSEKRVGICSRELNRTLVVDRETVGQFTGLTDKNGKEIFEGDILSTEYGTFRNTGMGHILFYKGMWTSFYGQDAIGRDCFDELYTVCTSREVIGNIHDNPELLNGG